MRVDVCACSCEINPVSRKYVRNLLNMSEKANSVSQICENSLTTLKDEVDPEELPPRTISHTTRRSRFRTGNVPLSPYILIDGRKLRSSLALSKKKLPRRVSFPTNDNHLITGYLEPANPWILGEDKYFITHISFMFISSF